MSFQNSGNISSSCPKKIEFDFLNIQPDFDFAFPLELYKSYKHHAYNDRLLDSFKKDLCEKNKR